MNVFISRPTWVPKLYEDGLNAFIKYLEQEEFEPHTLGTTDFPIDSPLDEVIDLMEKSTGVIVLGYPQIIIQKGLIKDEIVKDKHLPTEWNQIEGVLAYSLKRPLLIIHDIGISRGIFDRGAINKFIHEVDFRNNNWFKEEGIAGALKNWKEKIEKTKDFYTEYSIYSREEINLNAEEINLLIQASQDSNGSIMNVSNNDGLRISTNRKAFLNNGKGRERAKWEKSINKLCEIGLIESVNFNDTLYNLTEKGYTFIEEYKHP